NALRLKDRNVSATRTVNLTGASYAFLSFSYRRKSSTLTAGEDIIVQASTNGTSFATVFTIAGGGTADASYVDIFNQDITAYKAPITYIRFLTNNNVDDADTVYIDNVKIQFISYPLCYMTALDVNSVPANYHTTTILKHNLTATSLATYLAPYNFGIAKNTISISGALFNDANGNMDNLINGTSLGTMSGSTVYAYLVDSTGKVAHRTTLNTINGTYNFPKADVFTNYTLSLNKVSVNLGDFPPAVATPGTSSGSWTNTGDSYGTNNMAGAGIKAGLANCSILVGTAATNISAVNFGIERLPESDDRTINYTINTPGLRYDITGGLTGSDAEDGILGALKTYRITELSANAVLFYNNLVVTLNQVITLFDPALLKIDPADNVIQSTFKYASMDAAGLYDPTPATVTVRWVSVLPVTLVNFNGRLNGSKVDLFWSTSAELNTAHFEVERSTDAQSFTKIANVNAKGSTSSTTNYTETDPIPEIGLNYYRLKIVERNGMFVYSNIAQVKTNLKIEMVTKVKPNPFTGRVDVYLSLEYDTKVQFHLFDFGGKRVYTKEVKGLKGFNLFTLENLEKLPTATYVLKIVTEYNTLSEKIIKQ
ncbi:MAG: T9SS type A sorting domain-containing protein, partial [Ferruginibacter sp.]|nr:T9SS type A sorting domain-containing protein [Ferruginibacter sp.]